MPVEDPSQAGWIMHGRLTTASGFTLMGSDVLQDRFGVAWLVNIAGPASSAA